MECIKAVGSLAGLVTRRHSKSLKTLLAGSKSNRQNRLSALLNSVMRNLPVGYPNSVMYKGNIFSPFNFLKMHFDGALINEQGVTFAIAVVKQHVLNSSTECDEARRGFRNFFPSVPIILMVQDSRGRPTYQGRPDIVKFLANVSPSRIPWKRYSYN